MGPLSANSFGQGISLDDSSILGALLSRIRPGHQDCTRFIDSAATTIHNLSNLYLNGSIADILTSMAKCLQTPRTQNVLCFLLALSVG
ncbi:hypothetical protein KC325_g217 [Hortaea werneckii]|nr:hypothetical protein KC325_g217 [Hortaea werneckii]